MYLVNEENGRFFGWTEQLSNKPGMREATQEEVQSHFDSIVKDTMDEDVTIEDVVEVREMIEESLEKAIEQSKVEDEPDSTNSGSKKPARRRNSRRGR